MTFTNIDCVGEEVYRQIDDQVDWQVIEQVYLYEQVDDQVCWQVNIQINPIINKISQEINK